MTDEGLELNAAAVRVIGSMTVIPFALHWLARQLPGEWAELVEAAFPKPDRPIPTMTPGDPRLLPHRWSWQGADWLPSLDSFDSLAACHAGELPRSLLPPDREPWNMTPTDLEIPPGYHRSWGAGRQGRP